MARYGVSFWKPVPFLRILLPFAAGILLYYYGGPAQSFAWITLALGLSMVLVAAILPAGRKYVFRWVAGFGFNLVFLAAGMLIAYQRDIIHHPHWLGRQYLPQQAVIATIAEPLVAKQRSYKARASVEGLGIPGQVIPARGSLLLYFGKDSTAPPLSYGDQVLIRKALQPITNSGNPGGFDYKRHCAFRGIHYQVFLKTEDYRLLRATGGNRLDRLLIGCRRWVLSALRQRIEGRDELAVVEALLIGYRDDLDKDLVQSYSNTGVVHIIAISGLHLGMIYAAIVALMAPWKLKKWHRFTRPAVLILVLWAFTFIAGAAPSILRSAVMFSCIVLGEVAGRKTSIYNTLAASAFILLVINPFHLWDVGFQLSYTAVLGIVAFSAPIARWFYFRNKLLAGTWCLTALSIAAQVLTLPVILYYFHQFPNLFLFTNLLVVPLSGCILFAGILLLATASIPWLGQWMGSAVEYLTRAMNWLILRTDQLPFAVTDGIQVDLPQALLLFAALGTASAGLLLRRKQLAWTAAFCLLSFVVLRSADLVATGRQQKLIVYHIPRHTAIDIIEGRQYRFYGDSGLERQHFLRNFHLRPSRILNRVDAGNLQHIRVQGNQVTSPARSILILSPGVAAPPAGTRADAIIITGNPAVSIPRLSGRYRCSLFVFDASNAHWKIRLWKKDCDSLHLRHHSVPDKGAFEMDL